MSSERRKAAFSPYEPEEAEVEAPDGRPAAVMVKKRRARVKAVTNRWRIDEEWWRRPVSRLYFSCELENGARVTLFCDLLTGRWYRQNWV